MFGFVDMVNNWRGDVIGYWVVSIILGLFFPPFLIFAVGLPLLVLLAFMVLGTLYLIGLMGGAVGYLFGIVTGAETEQPVIWPDN